MRDLRIVFMGTPDFAVGVLKKLVADGINIVGVITAPDKPAGRGRKLKQSAVSEYAVSQALNVLQPKNLKADDFLKELKALNANLQIVVAFRMLPKVVWSMPQYGTFNLHASLLPNYRGAAPINWAIINGETKTGVTTFFIDDKIDTGAIISEEEISIEPDETAGSLHDKLMVLGSELVLNTVKQISKGSITAMEQASDGILKEAPKLNNRNTKIDWTHSAVEINSFIRGLNPYPVAWTNLVNGEDELKLKIYGAVYENGYHHHETGKVITTKKEFKIAVVNGYLNILELQLPGKRKMKSWELLNGFSFDKDAKVV